MTDKHPILDALLAEAGEPLGWWYLSFTDAARPKRTQFLGAVVVEASGMASAIAQAHVLGINPGGDVLGAAIPPEVVPDASLRNRLLNRREAESL